MSNIEEYFRTELLNRKLYADDSLPPAKSPMEVLAAPSQEQGQGVDSTKVESQGAETSQSSGQAALKLVHVPAGTLTDAHVFERLRVKEDAMAFVRSESHSVVKPEDGDTSFAEDDAMGDSQRCEGAWRVVRLISVSVPQAVAEVPTKGGSNRIAICVDKLRAVSKVNEPEVILHPSLQVGGLTLDPYDYEYCHLSFTKAVAQHMLLWAHAAANAGVERVAASRLSDQGKLPIALQVRALEAFKKGSLVFAPAYGELLPNDSDAQLYLARSQGVAHAAMLSHVGVKVVVACGDRRRTLETRLVGKASKNRDSCMGNIVPFWALLRCAGPRAEHNMVLETVVFRDPGFVLKASQYPHIPKGLEVTVEMPIARNVSHISAGEVLRLPFHDQ